MKYTTALIAAFAVAEARYKSGAVTGFEKFTYGKFIARIKAPNRKGTVSSFFTYWNGPNFYPGGWNELDVEIVPSVESNPLSLNIIYGDGHSKRESHDYVRNFDPKDDWHIYEMVWTPDYIAWSLDGKEVRRVDGEDPAVKFMTKGQSVMMNFWTPTFDSWGKGFDDKDMPWYVYYDYVETYTYNSNTKGFDFHWKDDFDTFDSNRWHKSDNTTFDANSTTFRAQQSYVLDGNLVLKMEPDLHHSQHGDVWDPTHVLPVMTQPTTHQHTKIKDDHPDPEYHHMDPYHQGYGVYEQGPWGWGGYPQYGYGGYPQYGGYANPWGHQYDPWAGQHHDWQTPHADPYYHHHPEHKNPPPPPKEPKQGGEKTPEKKGEQKSNTDYYHAAPVYHHPYGNYPMQESANEVINHPVDTHNSEPYYHHLGGAWDYAHHDETPFEHHTGAFAHHGDAFHGEDHHPQAHFDAGFWDLQHHEPHLGDHGHFEGEEHGQYHHVDRGVDGHHGTYYSYYDEREHHPAHASDYHDTHGIEHHPDDWVHDVHHPEVYDGSHFYADSHLYGDHHQAGDHHLVGDSHLHDATTYHGDLYNHDSDYHGGTRMIHDIEHSYDQLFHDIESQLHHGVEHHEIEYTQIHPHHDELPHGTDFHYDPHADYHHTVETTHGYPYAYAYGHGHDDHAYTHGHDDHHYDAHAIHADVHAPASPAPADKPAEKKDEQPKPEEKKAEIPAGKNLAYNPHGDHYTLHHNGSTGRFMQ